MPRHEPRPITFTGFSRDDVAVLARDDHRWTLAALGVILVLVAGDIALGPSVQFSGSLVIAPFLASAW
jgi:hypothetical protein